MASRRTVTDKPDTYQVITDKIVEMLEAGTAPWHKPWHEVGGIAMSMSTGKAYRGINVLLLQMAGMAGGYSSPWWGTYKRIAERGGQVRKGEKGTPVVFFKMVLVDDRERPGEKKKIFFLKTYYVFNAEQTEDASVLGLPEIEVRPENEHISACETALASYYLTGPSLRHGGDAAYYAPVADHVQMPELEQFDSSEEYYGALFHETVHSTGHEKRLRRPGVADLPAGHRFGDELYSKEELVAELGSAFLSGRTGIAAATLANSAAYLASWIRVLKGDPKLVVQAAQQAQKAVDLILGEATVETESEAPAAELVPA